MRIIEQGITEGRTLVSLTYVVTAAAEKKQGCLEINIRIDGDITADQVAHDISSVFGFYDVGHVHIVPFGRGEQLEDGSWDVWLIGR